MTIEKFYQQAFSINTEIIYDSKIYKVLAVDFEECLIAIDEIGDSEPRWKRCENCEINGDTFAKKMYDAYFD